MANNSPSTHSTFEHFLHLWNLTNVRTLLSCTIPEILPLLHFYSVSCYRNVKLRKPKSRKVYVFISFLETKTVCMQSRGFTYMHLWHVAHFGTNGWPNTHVNYAKGVLIDGSSKLRPYPFGLKTVFVLHGASAVGNSAIQPGQKLLVRWEIVPPQNC